MCKTRMRTLKRWAQERSDDQKPLNIVHFTPSVCRALQIELARRGTSSIGEEKASSTHKEKLPVFNGKGNNWAKVSSPESHQKWERNLNILYVIKDPELEDELR